ncbi:phosphodiester glycosidase family protein [Candidatus Woesearchaeota archaeon]|nr:phosphodiester glycosidase family protein [Candidatus Woesearchaeota archaeon]
MGIHRRDFLRLFAVAVAVPREIIGGLERLASLEYGKISHTQPKWVEIQDGLYFARVDILRGEELIDRIAIAKFDPSKNKLRVFTKYEGPNKYSLLNIEQWQRETGASVMFNSAQYLAKPWGAPIAYIITDGKLIGQRHPYVRGMLVAEPNDKRLTLVDLLDFEYDKFDIRTTSYTQGVQHWPILLDRKGKIKVNPSDWQANRTVVAKDRSGNMLVFVTEGGFFTLYNFGRFLKESGLDIHTAMNLDGGYEASMAIRTPSLHYTTYGQFETYGPNRNVSIPKAKIAIPTAIGIFPRK